MHWKKSFLVINKIPRLFLNILTVDDKHYLVNWENLAQPIEMQLSQKEKNISQFFFSISKIYIKLKTFARKGRPSYLMYSLNYRVLKTWLDNCLKIRVSEDPETDNMANGLKQCCNLNGRSFSIFIKHFRGRYVGMSLF